MTHAVYAAETFGDPLHACVACGDEQIGFWRQKNYQYTASATAQRFRIYRCKACGTGFLNQPPHRQWLQAIYQYSGQALTRPVTLDEILRREARFPNCTVDARRLAGQAHRLNTSGLKRALDIGSGFGFYTQALRQLGYQTVSINPGQYENQVFSELNGDAPLPILFEHYQTTQTFGVVMLSQVLEHLLAPEQAVARIADRLASGGVLACAVPNYASFLVKLLGTRDNACLWVPEHVNYFTEQGLRRLLARNGLVVQQVEQVTRIPFDAISRRLGLQGRAARWLDAGVKAAQKPFASLMNRLGLGLYIHIYAVKP